MTVTTALALRREEFAGGQASPGRRTFSLKTDELVKANNGLTIHRANPEASFSRAVQPFDNLR